MKNKITPMGEALKRAGIWVERQAKTKKPLVERESQSEQNSQRTLPAKNKGLMQDKFLEDLKMKGETIDFIGFQHQSWRGTLQDYDDFALKIRDEQGKNLLLFKHALMSIEASLQGTLVFKHGLLTIEPEKTEDEPVSGEKEPKSASRKNVVGTQFLHKFQHSQEPLILKGFEGKTWQGILSAYDEYSVIIK